eukprot:1535521-Prymnesium_polylepis.1
MKRKVTNVLRRGSMAGGVRLPLTPFLLCHQVAYVSADVERVAELLALPEDKFVEVQLKRAVELQQPLRVINRTIRLRGAKAASPMPLVAPHDCQLPIAGR